MSRLVCICMLAAMLSGCGAIHGMTGGSGEFLADHMPEWAGGLPADAPPRPSDPRYAKYIADQQAKAAEGKPSTASADKQAPAAEKAERR